MGSVEIPGFLRLPYLLVPYGVVVGAFALHDAAIALIAGGLTLIAAAEYVFRDG